MPPPPRGSMAALFTRVCAEDARRCLCVKVFSIRKMQRFLLRTQDRFVTPADSIVERAFSELCVVFHSAG